MKERQSTDLVGLVDGPQVERVLALALDAHFRGRTAVAAVQPGRLHIRQGDAQAGGEGEEPLEGGGAVAGMECRLGV